MDAGAEYGGTSPTDWLGEVDRAIAGDRVAYGRLIRLVTSHLSRWRAFDFQADWDDIVQEILLAVVKARHEGRFEGPGAVVAFIRQSTRYKFIDRIRAKERHKTSSAEIDDLDVDQQGEASWPPARSVRSEALELRLSLEQALERLPERERLAVVEVHVRGLTYEAAAKATGIPLGTLKRSLRTGLQALRNALEREATP